MAHCHCPGISGTLSLPRYKELAAPSKMSQAVLEHALENDLDIVRIVK